MNSIDKKKGVKIFAFSISFIILLVIGIYFLFFNNVTVSIYDDSELINTIKVKKNTLVKKIYIPEKENYDFLYYICDNKKLNGNEKIKKDSDFYAVYKKFVAADSFTVSFNTNGGSEIEDIKVINGEQLFEPSQPTKDNFIFKNWLLDGEIYDFSTPVISNITLEAEWEEIKEDTKIYTVSFDTQGGSKIESKKVIENSTVSKPSVPIKNGYTFVEWQLNGKKYDFSKPINKDIKLTATWSKNTSQASINYYFAEFDTNGGNSINKQIIKENDLVKRPDNPKKNGYTFVEWQLDNKCYNFSSKVTKNIVLKATWKKNESSAINYSVSFNTNGGSAINSQTIKDGGTVSKPSNPTRNGYAFKGWLLNGNTYDFSTPVKSNIVLVASWENNIWEVSKSGSIIKYKGNDANVVIPSTIDGITINSISSNAFSSSNMITLTLADSVSSVGANAFTKLNNKQMKTVYITASQKNSISNWYNVFGVNSICFETSNTGTFVIGKIGGSCQSWTHSLENKDDHYFIGYALGTCPNIGGNHNYYISKEDTPLFNVDAVGYEFEGWTGTGLSSTTKNVIIPKGSTGDRSYIPHCREYIWYIKLDYSNYSGLDFSHVDYNKSPYCGTSSSKCKYKYSESVTIPDNQVIRNGYTFVGWSKTINGPVVYKPGDKVSKLFTTDNATLTLYPIWN